VGSIVRIRGAFSRTCDAISVICASIYGTIAAEAKACGAIAVPSTSIVTPSEAERRPCESVAHPRDREEEFRDAIVLRSAPIVASRASIALSCASIVSCRAYVLVSNTDRRNSATSTGDCSCPIGSPPRVTPWVRHRVASADASAPETVRSPCCMVNSRVSKSWLP